MCVWHHKTGVLLHSLWRAQGCCLQAAIPSSAVPRHVSARNLCYATAPLGKDDVILCVFETLLVVKLIAMVYFVLQIF